MQAVILAAGQGKRLRPLTDSMPKPMVSLLGKPILEYTIDFLPADVDDLIIVVGYHADAIKNYFGSSWKGRRIQYVEQKEARGTADALFQTQPLLTGGRFLLVNGDNVNDMGQPASAFDHDFAIFAVEHPDPKRFGVIETNDDGTLKRIVEKPEHPATNLISTGSMILSPGIFDTTLVLHPVHNEFFIPDLMTQIMAREPVQVLMQDFWVAVDRPEDIPKAEARLREWQKTHGG
jgi:bifunctional UDP-N-acetylglucosamine pyrophosphorylase/glucosamine-1-phosphate N-acetyltransferase